MKLFDDTGKTDSKLNVTIACAIVQASWLKIDSGMSSGGQVRHGMEGARSSCLYHGTYSFSHVRDSYGSNKLPPQLKIGTFISGTC